MSPISSALIITVIGMGLVFIAIIALWGLMELMVRVTARYATGDETAESEEGAEETELVGESEAVRRNEVRQDAQAREQLAKTCWLWRKKQNSQSMPRCLRIHPEAPGRQSHAAGS